MFTFAASDGKRVRGIAKCFKNNADVWDYVEAGFGLICDGLMGYTAGKLMEKYKTPSKVDASENQVKAKNVFFSGKNGRG